MDISQQSPWLRHCDAPAAYFGLQRLYQRLSREDENVNISYVTFYLYMLDLLGNRR